MQLDEDRPPKATAYSIQSTHPMLIDREPVHVDAPIQARHPHLLRIIRHGQAEHRREPPAAFGPDTKVVLRLRPREQAT
jgi:hypothetical protein